MHTIHVFVMTPSQYLGLSRGCCCLTASKSRVRFAGGCGYSDSGGGAAAPPPTPVAVAVEVVEPLAAVAAAPQRKVGFDAEVPPAKAAAGVTPGLPSYSKAGGREFYSTRPLGSRRYVRRSRRRRRRAVRRRRTTSAPTAS